MDFLDQLAGDLFREYKQDISGLRIVFPNVRSGNFFRKSLGRVLDKPVWMPKIQSLEVFMAELSGLENFTHDSDYIFRLMQSYDKIAPGEQNPASFWFWAELLIHDFDEIDMAMVDTHKLFTDLLDQRELDATFSDFLTEEQLEAIRLFRKSFAENKNSDQKDRFLNLWTRLPKLYSSLKGELKAEGKAWKGMQFREAAEKVSAGLLPTDKMVIFAGFNNLSRCEITVFSHWVEAGKARIFWDIDAHYMDNSGEEAGYFLRKYRSHPVLGTTFPKEMPRLIEQANPEVFMIGASLDVGQARVAGQLLEQLITGSGTGRTAVIMPKQEMLFPMLHALPQKAEKVNVTMGYPLSTTPVFTLLEHIINLQLSASASKDGSRTYFNHRHVLGILRHPYVLYSDIGNVITNIRDIESTNRILVSLDNFIGENPVYRHIFQRVDKVNGVFDYLSNIIMVLLGYIREEQKIIKQRQNPGVSLNLDDYEKFTIEEEYFYQVYVALMRINDVFTQLGAQMEINDFWLIYRQILASAKLPFTDDGQEGLHLMGLLESRNLDFDNIIILSANEDNFPPTAPANSLIPFSLRKGFGLDTFIESDAMYAYVFKRLLHRAKKVYLIYNAVNEGQANGQISRFALQLKYESNLKIINQTLLNEVKPDVSNPISVAKTPEIMALLNKYLVPGNESEVQASLKPSALNAYIDCTLRFYFAHVARLSSSEDIAEEMSASDFGNVLHKAMEKLYDSLQESKKSNLVEAADFVSLMAKAADIVSESFSVKYSATGPDIFELNGRNVIVREIITKYVNRILELDKAYAPFEVLGLESGKDYKYQFPLNIAGLPQKINLNGIIDRIDRKAETNTIRVLDYKTGGDMQQFKALDDLFDRESDKRPKAVFQVLFYAMLYAYTSPKRGDKVTAGLIKMTELFGQDYNYETGTRIAQGSGKSAISIEDVTGILPDFEAGVRTTLEELFNSEIPFSQTPVVEKCLYCAFKDICDR